MLREYFFNLATDKTKGGLAFFTKGLLFLLSLIYSAVVRFLSFAYKKNIFKAQHLNCKVISIGNITWGGTGKTPIVEMVALKLFEAGRRVAIQSRGYKIKKQTCCCKPKTAGFREIGDEPFMLKENLKEAAVIAGSDRANLAKMALEKDNLDTIILDDGFQHWRIFRDLDILAIDSANPFGNGFLIPRGILREPLSSLKRADIFFLTHTDLVEENLSFIKQKLSKINKNTPIIESVHSPVGFYNILDKQRKIIDTNLLKGRKLGLLTAIGNPDSFLKTLLKIGLEISQRFIFPDHYEFERFDFEEIKNTLLEQNISTLLTTQKDAVRLQDFCLNLENLEILVLKIEIKITNNEDIFFNRLFSLYKR